MLSNQHKNGDQRNNPFSSKSNVVAQIMLFLVLVPKSYFLIRLLEANTQYNLGMGLHLPMFAFNRSKELSHLKFSPKFIVISLKENVISFHLHLRNLITQGIVSSVVRW